MPSFCATAIRSRWCSTYSAYTEAVLINIAVKTCIYLIVFLTLHKFYRLFEVMVTRPEEIGREAFISVLHVLRRYHKHTTHCACARAFLVCVHACVRVCMRPFVFLEFSECGLSFFVFSGLYFVVRMLRQCM